METDNPFEKVLDRLREKGWMKGDYGLGTGPNCILGGIKIAALHMSPQAWVSVLSPEIDFLVPIIKEHYGDRSGTMSCIPNFNDHPDTTFEDVERVLEKAAVKWEEERVMRDE